MKAHEKAFGEIKNYYNDITHNNLDLIKSLKEEVSAMKKKDAQVRWFKVQHPSPSTSRAPIPSWVLRAHRWLWQDEKSKYEIAQENKRMQEPLDKALEVTQWQHLSNVCLLKCVCVVCVGVSVCVCAFPESTLISILNVLVPRALSIFPECQATRRGED